MTAQPPFVLQGYAPPPAPAAPPAPSPSELMQQYRVLKAEKEGLQAIHAEQLRPINEQMDKIEIELLRVMSDTGLSNFSDGDFTAYRQPRTKYRIVDPHAFRQWVEAQNRPDFYENRVSKDVLENHLDTGGALPPGIEVNSEVVVNIRKK